MLGETPGKMYALAVVLSALATVATGLRFYARYIKKAGFSWDDYTVLPALLLNSRADDTFDQGALPAIWDGIPRFNMYFMKGSIGRSQFSLIAPPYSNRYFYPLFGLCVRFLPDTQALFAVSLSQVVTFGFTKLSVLLFYQRYVTSEELRAHQIHASIVSSKVDGSRTPYGP
ncbi:MAG: hypothetical protein Q9186_000614 [Xanthomendoza sp. 1 TL-2023]